MASPAITARATEIFEGCVNAGYMRGGSDAAQWFLCMAIAHEEAGKIRAAGVYAQLACACHLCQNPPCPKPSVPL
jgi:hypothetical protein